MEDENKKNNIREKIKGKVKEHKMVIVMQLLFLGLVFAGIYLFYPKADMTINGNFVKFSSTSANVIMIADNPSFISPRYIEMKDIKNASLDLKPGKYYWKPYNSLIEGFGNEFEIPSEVGLAIDKNENGSDLVNVGNVKINVTKSKNGMMVGRIILDTNEKNQIEDKGEQYTGEQQ